jgi:hypothetical protein
VQSSEGFLGFRSWKVHGPAISRLAEHHFKQKFSFVSLHTSDDGCKIKIGRMGSLSLAKADGGMITKKAVNSSAKAIE